MPADGGGPEALLLEMLDIGNDQAGVGGRAAPALLATESSEAAEIGRLRRNGCRTERLERLAEVQLDDRHCLIARQAGEPSARIGQASAARTCRRRGGTGPRSSSTVPSRTGGAIATRASLRNSAGSFMLLYLP